MHVAWNTVYTDGCDTRPSLDCECHVCRYRPRKDSYADEPVAVGVRPAVSVHARLKKIALCLCFLTQNPFHGRHLLHRGRDTAERRLRSIAVRISCLVWSCRVSAPAIVIRKLLTHELWLSAPKLKAAVPVFDQLPPPDSIYRIARQIRRTPLGSTALHGEAVSG